MKLIILLVFSGNVAFLGYLFTRSGRQLARRPRLFWATLLPIASGVIAPSGFMTPDAFIVLLGPFILAYALLGQVMVSYARTGAPARHRAILALPAVGTTLLLLFAWGLTNFVMPGV